MTSFKFKWKTWTNNKLTPSYGPLVPVTDLTPVWSSVDGTERPGWLVPLQAARRTTSTLGGGADRYRPYASR
jgi:hypothetical protein